MKENIKLTRFSSGAGWACKLSPEDLSQVLRNLNNTSSDNALIDFSSFDDAAAYKIGENTILQTVDFFTPIVDDPYDFGRIAAANSLSDIYAMGGEPKFALNIVAFPSDDLPMDVLTEILRGGSDLAAEAGIPILGGHSIKDKEPKYGMAVTGEVDKDLLVKNNNAKEGDLLILTKPLGTGIISTAIKKDLANKELYNTAVKTMIHLNDGAKNAMNNSSVNACTDITGYGLLGHLLEMCIGSNVSSEIYYNDIPFIDTVENLASQDIIPGGSKKNLKYVNNQVDFSKSIIDHQKFMIADAQTSGGLLISVPERLSAKLISDLKDEKCLAYSIIGKIIKKQDKSIYIKG